LYNVIGKQILRSIHTITMTMYVIFARRSHFLILTALFFGLIGFIALVAVQYPAASTRVIEGLTKIHVFHHQIVKPFQTYRIITWLNPKFSLSHWGFNVHQAQLAVGSGEIFGEGLFNGILTKSYGVPNQWTDYIFTAIAEEFGFVASSVLILLFLVLVYRLVKVASTAQDTFGAYLGMGVVGMFAFQVFENIGMDMYLSPSTGITLPFISYGGTSLIANYMAVGFALSVAIRRKKLRFA
ncbi:MAG: FtsW/RodA/SpoVE family cell cycle protein, partial [Alicyclobacillus sp.]|nr:FtsW/RodA/SpoVE family cell cycle protein [Alicyclobacillus sp.]